MMIGLLARLRKRAQFFSDRKKIIDSGLFDENFYALHNPDVVASGQDLLNHFMHYGWREGRSPSSLFDLPEYVTLNPTIRDAGINPLLDWLEKSESPSHATTATLQGVPDQPPKSNANSNFNDNEVARSICDSGLFDASYYVNNYPDLRNLSDPLHHFIRHGSSEMRNPSAEFDNYFYSKNYLGGSKENPVVHYMRTGKALGYLTRPLHSVTLDTVDVPPRSASPKVAIHIHLFYSEFLELILSYLQNAPFDFDLFISTCSQPNYDFFEAYFNRLDFTKGKVVIRLVQNRGRDIAPLLVGFPEMWSSYDYICHLHSKRSPHTPFGGRWMDWVMRNLFGDPKVVVKSLDYMEAHPDCGMLFPDNFTDIKKFCDWGGNKDRGKAFLSRLGFPSVDIPDLPQFPAGSMAWFRTCAFSALNRASLTIDDFELEANQVEGTLAHALERALPLVAQESGYNLTTFYLKRLPAAKTFIALHGRSDALDRVGSRWKRDTPLIALNRPEPLAPTYSVFNEKALEISWIIPDFGVGMGGHMTIFRMVEKLEAFGHRQTIWIQNPVFARTPEDAKMAIRKDYRKIGDHVAVRFLPDDVRQLSGDILIATDCWTVFPAAAATDFKERFYFIQDFEAFFHPHGDHYLLAEMTYKMGFAALCAGDWLQEKAQFYGMWSRKWDLCADSDLYFAGAQGSNTPSLTQSGDTKQKRIVFYSRGSTPRRATDLGLAAFAELARRRSDFTVLMFGEPPSKRTLNFSHREMGIMSPREIGDMYRSSDLGVSFSTTNYSLVPLEMMACGLPVVEIDCESSRAAFPDGSVTFAGPSPIAIADALEKLMDDRDAATAQVSKALTFVRGLDWTNSAKLIERAVIERLEELNYRTIQPEIVAAPLVGKKVKASVIIPTFNGGLLFREVLQRAAQQGCDFNYDILVVDSSSTDDTAQYAADFGSIVRVHVIPQSDFQHGRTRNLAISMTQGDVVAVLTQDATPMNSYWLKKLVEGFTASTNVAGVYGRHKAYKTHNLLVARDLEWMFDKHHDLGPVFNLDRGLPNAIRRGGQEWQMIMHFYSDNNSAMRRSVWKELPYPEIDWGEDQVWAWQALKVGFSKVYANDAVVYHSHDLPPKKQFQTGVSEGRMWAEHFGFDLHPQGSTEASLAAIERHERRFATEHGIAQSVVDDYVLKMSATIEGRRRGADESCQTGLELFSG